MFNGLEKIEDIEKFIIDDTEIKYDMLDNFAPKDQFGNLITINKNEGSLVNDIMAPISIEIAKLYYDFKWLIKIVFPQFSSGEFLTLWAENFGVIRKTGIKAFGQCLITANKYTIIPKHTMIKTLSELQFRILDNVNFEDKEEMIVDCEAIEIGSKYNIEAYSIISFILKPNGVKTVTNPQPFYGGVDFETDDLLLERFLFQVRNPSGAGNITDYIRWAKEVQGVYNVRVKPLWKGPGTVKVLITGKEGEPLDFKIIENAQNYIDAMIGQQEGRGKAPIGAFVTVATLITVTIDITIIGMIIEKDFTLDSVKNNIENDLKTYFNDKVTDYLIRLNEVRGIVAWAKGVKDIKDILINGLNESISIGDEDFPVLGEVLYTNG